MLNFGIFENITAFAKFDNGKVCSLELISEQPDKLTFADNKIGLKFDVYKQKVSNSTVLKFCFDFKPQNLGGEKFGAHFSTDCAVGLHIGNIKGIKQYFATYRKCQYWVYPFFEKDLKKLPVNTQTVFAPIDDEFLFLTTLCDKEFKSTIEGNNSGFDIYVYSNNFKNSADTSVLTYGFSNDVYELPKTVFKDSFITLDKVPNLREDRKYPPVLEYLGWCSWDAFHMYVTHENLVEKAKEFKNKEIPVRWMLLDDMWGDVPNNCFDNYSFHSRELESFEAAPERFPNGLKGIVSELKEKYKMFVGLWHPTTGYWNGINPNSKLAEELDDLLFFSDSKKLVHSYRRDKIFEYYDRQHKFYKDCGIDFIKIDNQASVRPNSKYTMPIGIAAKNQHDAIENVADKYYNGQLINCMGMATENTWNREKSSVNRFSGDFLPENRNWFLKHITQCVYNSVVLGCIYTGDWDMWWSDDGQAVKNAVLRAMSGGPIYLSDELGRSKKDVIMPLIYSDGKIIRLPNPAKPTVDCLFENPHTSGKIFKIFNTFEDRVVLAIFNLDENENEVKGTVSVKDFMFDTDKEYCVYDWFSKTCVKINGNEILDFKLKDYDDFKLLCIVPLENGSAFIGNSEKYMSIATFKKDGRYIERFSNGKFLIYNEGEITNGERIGENLFLVD